MAKARVITKRRKAVQNIHKITRTMQMVATAQFQTAFNRLVTARPYMEKLAELVEQLWRSQVELPHPLLEVNSESNRSVLIVLTSNRGLCGGYNTHVLEAAVDHINKREESGDAVDITVMGRKGISYFKYHGKELSDTDTRFEDKPQFSEVEVIAQRMIDRYTDKQIDSVYVTYMKFISAGVQRVQTVQLLPVERPRVESIPDASIPEVEYEFSPAAEDLLAELLPATIKVKLFRCFIDAAVSEQVSRMVAMRTATEAANDMIKSLTQQYNRARQSQITLELLDIIGGAEALR
ncbi:MAG: ATP synthase F1 subunit gamma [Planctomycetota bacterium]|jgi:F-type H+-transporting ATPase subunit gamma